MKKLTQRQTDKLFIGHARDLYDKFVENAVALYSSMFPDKCSSKDFDHTRYDLIRERLLIEMNYLYVTAKGEKNVKKKCCKEASAKRTVAN